MENIEQCWKLAVEFQALEFRNWLISQVERYTDAWEVGIYDLGILTTSGLAGAPLANRVIENLAYLVVNNDVDFTLVVTTWVKDQGLMGEGPALLGELLGQMETFKQYKATGKLFKPQIHVCLKYHKHRSMEEREACPEYCAESEGNEPELSDAEGEDHEKATISLNDVDVVEGENEWVQQQLSKKIVNV